MDFKAGYAIKRVNDNMYYQGKGNKWSNRLIRAKIFKQEKIAKMLAAKFTGCVVEELGCLSF